MQFLGIDLGSSSIKVSLVDGASGKVVASASHPEQELAITSPQPGFAEQDPALWWDTFSTAMRKLKAKADTSAISAIGISYQMHGLVVLDAGGNVLRPSIIWCDSRAVQQGERLRDAYGKENALAHLYNEPGNFTAAKLAWVQANEPELYEKIATVLLPGDWLAYKLTGELSTSRTGLSEQIAYDFFQEGLATDFLKAGGIDPSLYPKVLDSFEVSGKTITGFEDLGLKPGIPIAYRAGDQPNNAFALGVSKPGQVSINGGTSGVLYAVGDSAKPDMQGRVNTFAHVTHTPHNRRLGMLACVNGTGIFYGWVRKLLQGQDGGILPYPTLNALADSAPPGSDDLLALPYGNGAERTLGNKNLGARFAGLDFTRQGQAHIARAALEGIAYSLVHCLDIFKELGTVPSELMAGHANLFLNPTFGGIIATIARMPIQLKNVDGAQGAAYGAGIGIGAITQADVDAWRSVTATIEPVAADIATYQKSYADWKGLLAQTV